jgi:serine/threonine-protein phosphatase 6 regulatory ankyrin repeat subunit A
MSVGVGYCASFLRNFILVGHLDIVELLLEHSANIKALDRMGRHPLHYAAYNGHTDIVELLWSHNAVANPRDKSQRTMLHWVVSKGVCVCVWHQS